MRPSYLFPGPPLSLVLRIVKLLVIVLSERS
jgi:hypothetical protein